jgi:ACS family hexuronate transporter-like MFS transporter
MQTLPPSRRSRGIALTYSGGSAGAILTPLVIAPVAAQFGWRGAFWFTGLIGALWIAGWWVLSRRADLRSPAIAAAALAEESLVAVARPRFSDRRLWAFLLAYALGALPLGFVVYCAALYLSRVLGASQETIGHVLWVPPLGSELGIFFWGFVADALAARSSKLDAVQRLLPIAMLLSLPLALVPAYGASAHAFALVLAQLFFAMFVASAFQLLVISYGTEVFSREHAGLIGGIGSGAYGAGLALAMPLFGKLFDARDYTLAFALAACCPVLGYACFRALGGAARAPSAVPEAG